MKKKALQPLSILLFSNSQFRLRYTRFSLMFFGLVITLFLLNDIVFNERDYAIPFTIALGTLVFLYTFVTEDTTNIVTGMMLWTLVFFASYFTVSGDGLYDTAIFAFPCILIFSSMLSGVFVTIPILAFMVVVLYFLAYLDSVGLKQQTDLGTYSPWGKASNLSLILIIYGLTTEYCANFLKKLLLRVHREKDRATSIQKEAQTLAEHDSLTSLPNDIVLKRVFEKLANSKKVSDDILAIMTIDIDNFRWVNTSLGFETADELLCELKGRLQNLTNDNVRLFRSSGREFRFLLQVIDYDSAIELAQRVLNVIGIPTYLNDFEFELTACAGIAFWPFDSREFNDLLRKSHMALFRAKEEGAGTIRIFDNDMAKNIHQKYNLVHELKHALSEKQFRLFYQPKVNLMTGKTQGAEALIRWQLDDGRILAPLQFIPAAEDSGLIVDIGKWALEQACLDCAKWHQIGFPSLTIAVNLSPVQFRRGNLPHHVLNAMKYANLPGNFLELEITESIFINDLWQIQRQINHLARKGISISIDDFGTGYSNMSYLNKFNASSLKIDMSFVRQIHSSPQNLHIVDAIIRMSKAVGLENVAEGIEDEASFKILKDLGCHLGQGYYWSKPIPEDQFRDYLRNE